MALERKTGGHHRGRPTIFSPELADRICERLADGESLRRICLDEDMPGKSTVMRWLAKFPEFRDQYARAREVQADTLFDECLEIADDSSGDFTTKETDSGPVQIVNHEHIARSKLRVDTRKWMAGKLAPKKYGDRQQIEHDASNSLANLMRRFPPQVFRPTSNDGS
jgi:hypothetical protein